MSERWQRPTGRRWAPPVRIGDSMATVPPRTKPLSGSACDSWQTGMAIGLCVDGIGPMLRPPLRCWHCEGDHLTHECSEVRT